MFFYLEFFFIVVIDSYVDVLQQQHCHSFHSFHDIQYPTVAVTLLISIIIDASIDMMDI